MYEPEYRLFGDTTAMKLAEEGIIPPKEWIHDRYLRNHFG